MNQPNELLIAAKHGDLDKVKNLIEQNNASVQCMDICGNTPLSLAAENAHIEVVKYLESKGSDINHRNKFENTPLILAARAGHLEVVKYLESKGLDINHKNNAEDTPLSLAAFNGHLEVVKYLESKGSDINIRDNDGDTPLSQAAPYGHLEVVKYLESKSSDINHRNNNGNTPLSIAAWNGQLEVVKYLESKGSDINHRNNYGRTPLRYVAERGHLELAQHLLLNGAGIGEKLTELTSINYKDIILLCATTTARKPVTKLTHPKAIVELDEFENHIKQFSIARLFILLNAVALKTSETESTNKKTLVKATNITIAECISKIVNLQQEQSDELFDNLVILKRCSMHIEKLNEGSTTMAFKNLLNALSVFSMKFACARIIVKNNLERLSIWSQLPVDLKDEMPDKINFYRSLPEAFLKPITSNQGRAPGLSADPDHLSISVNVRSCK